MADLRLTLLALGFFYGSAVTARADTIFDYGSVPEPILSATFNADFAALFANPTIFGTTVNFVRLFRPGFAVLDLSDSFFGIAGFPATPAINMGPLETGVISASIPGSFFPALATGSMGYDLLFTDTDDAMFALGFISLEIKTGMRTIESVIGPNDGFGLGIPIGGALPAPLPVSIPFGATGTGFDETISSKALQANVPEPGYSLLLGVLALLLCCKRGCLRCGLTLVFCLGTAARASDCPPKEGNPTKVPGKPGETGWLLEDTQVDDKGNKIELWCLQGGNGHGGPDFARLWKPKGAKDEDAVWIAACLFPKGNNLPNKDFVDVDAVGKPNGKPDEFLKLTWLNYEPPPDGANDWDFSFDTRTRKLTVKKTKGQYKIVTFFDRFGDIRKQSIIYQTTEVIDTDTYDAPKDFKDLKFKDQQISAIFPGPDGVAGEAFTAMGSVSGNSWSYTLRLNDLGGSGTAEDPFVGQLSALQPGDKFTISGTGIQNPFVSGAAVLPEYGAWVIDSSDSRFVTFRATSSATFIPGIDISGFGFSSSATPGLVFWNVASSNEAIGSSGIVTGPAVPPDQLHLAGPSPNRMSVGDDGLITASLQANFNGVPGAKIVFTKVAGNFVFTYGTPSPDGMTSVKSTDGNGNAQMSFTAQGAGIGLIKATATGTTLVAYSLFFMQ